MSQAPSVSVVICCYTEQRWDQILAAVESVQQQTLRPTEVVLVVDYNDDLLKRALEQLPDVIVVPNANEKGLSGGKNTGLRVATVPVVAFLDDDAVAAADWLRLLCAPLADDSVAGVGSAVLPAWQHPPPRWFPHEFLWVVGCSYVGLPTEPTEIRNPFGGAMLVRRELALRCGGFRADLGRVLGLPAGCEETEFCIRLRQSTGCRFMYEPRTTIDHFVPASRLRFRYFLHRCYHEGVSKAAVARSVGAGDALAAERRYVSRTLPAGVARGLLGVFRGDLGGLASAASIVAGTFAAGVGYCASVLRRQSLSSRAPTSSPETSRTPRIVE